MWGYPKWIGNLRVVIVLEICWEDINIKLPIYSVYISIYVCILFGGVNDSDSRRDSIYRG
jgi:hypothetical protein